MRYFARYAGSRDFPTPEQAFNEGYVTNKEKLENAWRSDPYVEIRPYLPLVVNKGKTRFKSRNLKEIAA